MIYSGAYVIAPALATAFAWFVLSWRADDDKRLAAPSVAWQAGLLFAFLFYGVQAYFMFVIHGQDILVMGALLPWLYLRRSRTAAVLLIVFQLISVWFDWRSIDGMPTGEHWAVQRNMLQLVWRLGALGLLTAFVWEESAVSTNAAATGR